MTGEFRTKRTSSVEVTLRQGMCTASVRDGKFTSAFIMDRHSGYVSCGSLVELEKLILDINAVMADVRAELSK